MKLKSLFLTVVGLFVAGQAVFAITRPIRAAGTVGTGTPDSCSETALDVALAGGGTVTFNCGAAPTTLLILTEKVITQNTVLDGNGLITLSGGNRTRVLHVNPDISLELRKLTIAYGAANDTSDAARDGIGGGILNDSGTLLMTDSMITFGRADHDGGAIYNRGGTLTLVRVTLSSNYASDRGGAILNEKGTVNIANGTLSSNFAGKNGGGIFNSAGKVIITHGTVYDNSAGFNGSGILNDQEGTVALKNTIIAGASSGAQQLTGTCSGVIVDGNKNLQFPGDSCGKTISIADPVLGKLSNNGGFVLTHALKEGSLAIDQADLNVCQADPINSLDARNDRRPVGKGCDIGAYEFDPKKPGKGFAETADCVCSTPTPTKPPGVKPTPVRIRTVTPTPRTCQATQPNLPCNCNGFCDPGESYYTCPQDCPYGPIPSGCVELRGKCTEGKECCSGRCGNGFCY